MTLALPPLEIWFVVGSQHLYGKTALDQVADNARQMVAGLNASGKLPVKLIAKPVMTTSWLRGRSRFTFLRLCVRAPRMRMKSVPDVLVPDVLVPDVPVIRVLPVFVSPAMPALPATPYEKGNLLL